MIFFQIIFFLVLNETLSTSSLELFPTYHSVGVTKYSRFDATFCFIQYCFENGECHDGYPLTRVTDGKFVGSIFWLEPSTTLTVYTRCGINPDADTEIFPEDVQHQSVRTNDTRTFPEISDATKVLYVAPVSSNSLCLEIAPCSLDEAVPQITSGTHVVFKSGRYFVGDYKLESVGGTSENPIVFRPYGDGEVILDGSEEIMNLALLSGPGLYRTSYYDESSPLNESDPENIVMIRKSDQKRTRLVRYQNRTAFEHLSYVSPVDGSPNWGWYVDFVSHTFDVNIGSLSFDDYEFRMGNRQYFAWISQDYYYFTNLTMQFYGFGGVYRLGIYLSGSSYSWIRNMKFDHMLTSIHIKWRSDYTLIEDCEFIDSKYRLDWYSVKDDLGDRRLEAGAIFVTSGGYGIAGRGLVIRRNTFKNLFDGFNLQASSILENEGDLYNLPSNEVDVYENLIEYTRDDGFECDGICQNVRVWSNTLTHTITGISMAPARVGPTYIIGNEIINITGWTGFKFGYNVFTPPAGFMFMFHNVVWNRGIGDQFMTGDAACISYFPWSQSTWRNNILFGERKAIKVMFDLGKEDCPISLDYDAVATETEVLFYWQNVGPNGYIDNLNDFFSLTGQEEHGVFVENITDVFISSTNMNLKENSVLKGKGVRLNGINGANPDIGLISRPELPIVDLYDDDDDSDEDDNDEDDSDDIPVYDVASVLNILHFLM